MRNYFIKYTQKKASRRKSSSENKSQALQANHPLLAWKLFVCL